MATEVQVIPALRQVNFVRGAGTFSIPFEEIAQLVYFLQVEVVEAYGLDQPSAWMNDVSASKVLGNGGSDGEWQTRQATE